MTFSAILGAWIAAFLTLGIFSYLYKDNPFYKIAENVFVGVSAAYVVFGHRFIQIFLEDYFQKMDLCHLLV